MRIDITGPEAWYAVSDRLRGALPFQDPAVQVQAYAGYQHALYEATQGLARLFSHKKTIAIVEPAEPAIEQLAIAFSADAYTVKRLSVTDLEGDADALFAPLLADLIFILYAEDDPVTGRYLPTARIDEVLKDKRVFRVKLSHAAHVDMPLVRPAPFEVRVLSLRPDFAAVVAGERFRVSPILATRLTWSVAPSAFDELRGADEIRNGNQQRTVREFEASLPAGFRPFFRAGEARTSDRAVIVTDEFDGSAVIDELARLRGVRLPEAGTATAFETTSPCRWNHPRFAEWLSARGERDETVRGLILIDAAQIDTNLASQLAQVAANLRRLQTGSD